MKRPNKHTVLYAAIVSLHPRLLPLLLLPLLLSCSMMQEDRSDCPDCRNPLRVVLRYDYNMDRANMFADHVQQATVYVADAQTGTVIACQTATNSALSQPLKAPTFAFNFEGLPEGSYRLMTTATTPASGVSSASVSGGSPARTNPAVAPIAEGDNLQALAYTLSTAAATSTVALDTVWHARDGHVITLPADQAYSDTLSLMRLTNNISLMLIQTENPTDNRHDRYDVRITDHNARLDGDAMPIAGQEAVAYLPYAAWTTETVAGGGTAGSRAAGDSVIACTAHYDLSFNRLIAHEQQQDNARLIITNREDGKVIADLDLVYYLALARSMTGLRYDVQEFLDREYDYHLDVILQGNQWRYMNISIGILSWSLHIQNEEL